MTPALHDEAAARRTPADLADRLLDIKRIYHEPGIDRFPRARQALDRYAGAELIEVPSHQAIPGLYGNEGNVEDWVRIKREVLVLGERRAWQRHPKGEDLLWRPDLQQLKRSQSGQWNVRYKTPWKGRWVQQLTDLIATTLPECRIRYAF